MARGDLGDVDQAAPVLAEVAEQLEGASTSTRPRLEPLAELGRRAR